MPSLRLASIAARSLALIVVLALAACGGSSDDDLPLAFSASLSGMEETPPNASAASGTGLVTVDPDRRTLTASIVTTGMTDSDAHIHVASPGLSGPIVFPLSKAAGTTVWSTRTALSEAQFATLKNGSYYFNVHSPAFPNGEIRGQIIWVMPSPEQIARLQQARQQSASLELQLHQLQEIEDAGEHHFTGVGIGFSIGF
jgi:hypothetical protein